MSHTLMFRKPKETPKPNYYYEVELEPEQRILLIQLVRKTPGPRSKFQPLLDALIEARRVNMPLNRDRLDWDHAEASAKHRGSSVADWLFDLPRPWK